MGNSSATERVVAAAHAKGLDIELLEFPAGTRTAVDAANAVGCKPAQIVKSMIFDADGELVLALTSGAKKVDGANSPTSLEPIGAAGPMPKRSGLRQGLQSVELLPSATMWRFEPGSTLTCSDL